MAGRRPKPTAVKQLAGNPGKRPINVSEPKPPASTARAPRGLGAEARRFWNKNASVQANIGVLTQADENAFQIMAEFYGITERAIIQLHDEDLIVEGRDGPRKNPLVQIARDSATLFKSYAVEFGMTPASRSKIHPETGEQPSLLDELFAKVLTEKSVEDPLAEMRDG